MQNDFKTWLRRGVAIIIALNLAIGVWKSLYRVDATEVAVFQAPFTGTLSIEALPGTYLRLWSSVQEYKKQDNYSFEYSETPGENKSILVQFNDGGKAMIGGNVQWEMPQDPEHVLALHVLYGNQHSVDTTLMRNAINRAMTFTAPLMSATESYAARRAEFLSMFADQLENGIYQTQSVPVRQTDPITGEPKTIQLVSIVRDTKTGQPLRAEGSPLTKYNIHIQPPTITHMIYEPKVEAQIQQQRDNILAIQTAQAEAKKAEQAAITAAKNGEAQAAIAKWQQEVLKAKAVTEAEQIKAVAQLNADRDKSVAETLAQRDLEVATLKAKTADQYKTEQIKIGEGDAARKSAVLAADGALQQKLDTWLAGQRVWADSLARYQGEIVPRIQQGASTTSTGDNAFNNFMSMIAAKSMNDLALDMSIASKPPRK